MPKSRHSDAHRRILRDGRAAARAASLSYVSPEKGGIRRRRAGTGFSYVDSRGRRVTDARQLERIRSLVIPPAWEDVWIASSPRAHIQAVGTDARGRKQYRYHASWRKVRDDAKYQDVVELARALPALRKQLEQDLSRRGLSKDKVIATVVTLMESTRIRVGNSSYVQQNGSYGLTTLRDHHAEIAGASVHFRFRGKGGKIYQHTVTDRRLATIVKRCRDVPGQILFQYFDDHGRPRAITSGDVNDYLKRVTGRPLTAKEFRTWAGTLAAALILAEHGDRCSKSARKRAVSRALETVAGELGNTVAVCRRCYVNPAVIDAFMRGKLSEPLKEHFARARRGRRSGLEPEERAVLGFLRQLGQSGEAAAARQSQERRC